MKIDVIQELQEMGLNPPIKDGYAEVICPFHADSRPSGSVSIEHGGFKCFVCNASNDFSGYMGAVLKKTRAEVFAYLQDKYGSSQDKSIDVFILKAYSEELWKEEYLRKELYRRGLNDETIRLRKLGSHSGRIIIPVFNEAGLLVNLRKHRPGGADSNKVINHHGHGKPFRLYPIDQLKYDKVVLCGGELKALAALQRLNPKGIGAITATCGEGKWDPRFCEFFKDKTVYIAYDIDEAGIQGAVKVAHQLYRPSRELYIIKLPLDRDKYPNGDINDFIAEGGDLLSLIEETKDPWIPQNKRHVLNGDTVDIDLSQSVNAVNVSKRVRTSCVVTAIAQQPYAVPREVVVNCEKDQPVCGVCPVMVEDEGTTYKIHPEDPAVLGMVESSTLKQAEFIKDALDIPSGCRGCRFIPVEYFHVEDVRISPRLEISNREVQREMLPAYVMKENLVLNETYTIEGRMHPHPQTQASTLLISESQVSQDALAQYKNTDPHELEIFRPEAWTIEALKKKLNEIYTDLEANVTHIYKRRDMHLAIDLAYHSPLFFKFRNVVHKGWVEVLIMGDSAQGKTEATMNLKKHYGLGEKVDCKNASVAGLLGGLIQIAKKWFVAWGVIPNNDKRLVILEELKGMPVELISKLTDMRSSGIAEIPKIEKRRTHARTRIVALSNPRSERTMGTYNHGVLAIKELIRNPEDIRRFDLGIIVAASEIDATTINALQIQTMDSPHIYTSNLCQRLVLWAWTLNEVEFEDETYIVKQAIRLCDKFHQSIPLVDSGSMRLKLCRLAASLAARTYSTNEDYSKLIVRNCHVEFIANFIDRVYSSPVFGYDEYSFAQNDLEELEDPKRIAEILGTVPDTERFARFMMRANGFDLQDIMEWSGFDRDTAQQLISKLIRTMAIRRGAGRYFMVPAFICLLRDMVNNRKFKKDPDFTKEEF